MRVLVSHLAGIAVSFIEQHHKVRHVLHFACEKWYVKIVDSSFFYMLFFVNTDSQMQPICIKISFDPMLRPLLHPDNREQGTIDHQINRQPSVKDLIESLRVPHPEIGRITVNGNEVDFSYRVQDGECITVSPLTPPVDPCTPHILRPEPLPKIRFLVDVNVGRLCSLLRMAGFDTLYFPKKEDNQLADIVARKKCILLSRDIGLLKRKKIMHGHYVWNQEPKDQLREVLRLYNLQNRLKPFSRCMRCNALLVSVKKEKIRDRLEPLTKKYYKIFYLCPGCDQIYWSGSHKKGMESVLRAVEP